MTKSINNLKDKMLLETKNLKDKVILETKDSKTKLIIGICIVFILVFTFIGFTYGRYNPDPNSKVVQELLSKMLSNEKDKYEQIINEKDREITNILIKLNDSIAKTIENEKEIAKLKNKINSIKPPQNEKEIRQRLKDLGYETK
jgi:chorismate mutase